MRVVGHLTKEQIGKETQKPKNHLFCCIKTPHPKTKLTQKPNPDCFPLSKLHTPNPCKNYSALETTSSSSSSFFFISFPFASSSY
jgi:hypothetical protein